MHQLRFSQQDKELVTLVNYVPKVPHSRCEPTDFPMTSISFNEEKYYGKRG